MKSIICILNIVFIFIMTSWSTFSQENSYKIIKPQSINIEAYQNNQKEVGFVNSKTEFTTSESLQTYAIDSNVKQTLNNKEKLLSKKFIVEVDENGDYFFLANILSFNTAPLKEDGVFQLQTVFVVINGEYIGTLALSKPEWELVSIKDKKTIKLNKGKNTILFQSNSPNYYPNVDCIQVSKERNKLVTKNEKYDNFVAGLQENNIMTRSAIYGYSHTVWPVAKDAPLAAYKSMSNVPIVYTYWTKVYLTKGSAIFHTGPVDGESHDVNTVMYLFSESNPTSYNWYNDDYNTAQNGRHSKIQANIKEAGNYYLVVRSGHNGNASTPSGREGLVNVYHDGGLLNGRVPVSGYYMENASSSYTGSLNYFTGLSSGQPKLFFIDGNSMLYTTQPYTYYPPADFYWFDDARIKVNFNKVSSNIRLLVTSEGAWGAYWGACDLYAGVRDADAMYLAMFPSLKSGDAMQSANSRNTYNAASYAGGQVDRIIWVGSSYGSPFVWTTWDNYFGNKPERYPGAKTYSRSGSGYGHQVIAVHSTNGQTSGISHFSITNQANNHLHGYAYEGKIGTSHGRIFYPYASVTSAYGNVIGYYYDNTSQYSMSLSSFNSEEFTLQNSIENGLTIIEEVVLDNYQSDIVAEIKKTSKINRFDALYNAWKSELINYEGITNNPYELIRTTKGLELIDYCKSNLSEGVLYLSEKIFGEKEDFDLIISLYPVLFSEITKDKYGKYIEEIKAQWNNSMYTRSGEYIFPDPVNITKKYAKAIIDNNFIDNSKIMMKSGVTSNDLFDNALTFSVYPNPICDQTKINVNLNENASVSLRIYNANGQLIQNILNSTNLAAGSYSYHIEVDKLNIGLGLCILEINGEKYVRKVIKQ